MPILLNDIRWPAEVEFELASHICADMTYHIGRLTKVVDESEVWDHFIVSKNLSATRTLSVLGRRIIRTVSISRYGKSVR